MEKSQRDGRRVHEHLQSDRDIGKTVMLASTFPTCRGNRMTEVIIHLSGEMKSLPRISKAWA